MNITKINYKISFMELAFFLLIVGQIINKSSYNASVATNIIGTMCALLFCVMYLMKGKLYFDFRNFIICILVIISACISTFFSNIVDWSTDATSLIICVILYWMFSMIKIKKENMAHILRFYSFFCVFLSIWILYDFLFKIGIGWSGGATIEYWGIKKDPNYLASFLVVGFTYFLLSIFYSKKKNAVKFILLSIVFLGIFFTGSRGSFLVIVIIILLTFWKKLIENKKGIKTYLALLFGIVVLVVGYEILMNTVLGERMLDSSSYSNNIRLIIWKNAMKVFKEHWFFGGGIQSGTVYSVAYTDFVTHNCYVDLITGQGILGTFIVFLLFLRIQFVSRSNRFFVFVIMLSFYGPLFFINGYESLTFWLPLIICEDMRPILITDSYKELLWIK